MTRAPKSSRPFAVALVLLTPPAAQTVALADPPPATTRAAAGKNFLATRPTTPDEDRALLKLFDGLRVADVSDGMDAVGLQDVGLMDPRIAPLWRDLETFAHQVRGVAVT